MDSPTNQVHSVATAAADGKYVVELKITDPNGLPPFTAQFVANPEDLVAPGTATPGLRGTVFFLQRVLGELSS